VQAYGLRYFDENESCLIDPRSIRATSQRFPQKGWRANTATKPRNVLGPRRAALQAVVQWRRRQLSRLIINDFRRLRGMDARSDSQQRNSRRPASTMRAAAGGTKVLPGAKATFHEAVFNASKVGTDRTRRCRAGNLYFTGKNRCDNRRAASGDLALRVACSG